MRQCRRCLDSSFSSADVVKDRRNVTFASFTEAHHVVGKEETAKGEDNLPELASICAFVSHVGVFVRMCCIPRCL